MQHRYVGDIGDFAKFGLLRLFGKYGLRLGVNWYLNPAEESNQDGRFVRYADLRDLDPLLHDRLQAIVRSGVRSVHALEEGILPASTVFFGEPLSENHREEWFRRAQFATSDADIVLLDPDNGITPSSSPLHSPKHAAPHEIRSYLSAGQSVVVYQHWRLPPKSEQFQEKFTQMFSLGAREVLAVTFWRHGRRTFFVAATATHANFLKERLVELEQGAWCGNGKFTINTPSTNAASSETAPLQRQEPLAIQPTLSSQMHIEEAVRIKETGGILPTLVCPACHEPLRAHKRGTTNQQAHFEHRRKNPACSARQPLLVAALGQSLGATN